MNSSVSVMFFVIGNIIGSGFFMLPANLAPFGSNMLWSWIISGTMAMVFATILGKLAMIFPNSGSIMGYLKNIKRPSILKSISIIYWVSAIIGNSALVIAMLGTIQFNIDISIIGICSIILLSTVNDILESSSIEKFGIFLTISKFAILIGLPISLLIYKPTLFSWPASYGSFSGVVDSGISAFWAFLGIETAAMFGKGKAAKNALFWGVIACLLLYISSSLIVIGVVPTQELANSTAPFALFAEKFLGGAEWKYWVGIVALATCFGTLHGWIAATSRMAYECAKENLFPAFFLKKSPSGASFWGLWISSLGTAMIFLSVQNMNLQDQFVFIADLTIFFVFIFYAFCAYSLIISSKSVFDKLISYFGIAFILISFILNLKISIIALLFSCIPIIYLELFSGDKKQIKKLPGLDSNQRPSD